MIETVKEYRKVARSVLDKNVSIFLSEAGVDDKMKDEDLNGKTGTEFIMHYVKNKYVYYKGSVYLYAEDVKEYFKRKGFKVDLKIWKDYCLIKVFWL